MHAALTMDGDNLFAGDRIQAPQLSAYDLSVNDGSLQLTFKWDWAIRLDAVSPDEFYDADLGNLVFLKDAIGRVSWFSATR